MVQRVLANWLLAVAAASLAGCAAPVPGPNAGVQASQASPAVPLATNPTVGDEAAATIANRVQVEFPNGVARLGPGTEKQLDVAARLFRDVNPVMMYVAGHSDAVGDEYSNLLLSGQRAEVVKRGLVARGIPADRLVIQALGTSEPVSGSNPQSPENCRVVVTWRIL